MGIYLNAKKPVTLYQSECKRQYFVDKSLILEELFPLVETGNQFICVTRPRRFGKTVMANMIASFFGKGKSSSHIFENLNIAKNNQYKKYLNNYDLIYITFNEKPDKCNSYEDYMMRIKQILIADLKRKYPDCIVEKDEAIWDVLNQIYELEEENQFIFIFDEWDYIFHQDFVDEEDKKSYISFLSNLLKDKAYVSFVYMTGILPIAKYSSGSELNMFKEFTMSSQPMYSDYFGFTETEVDTLYHRYIQITDKTRVTREGLRNWYDGYRTLLGERLYNPRSVVFALENNQLGNYWTSSGPYDEIFYYIKNNIKGVKNDIALMIAGEHVVANVEEYSATSQEINSRDQILSAMVVYGFLTCENNQVSIPNKELMDRFVELAKRETSLGYIYQLAKESERMLTATLTGDTKTMIQILERAHSTETDELGYNNEIELSSVIRLVYLSARDQYDIQRENRAGVGRVDYIFYPIVDRNADAIILELKVNDTAENAIRQIKDRNYIQRLIGKVGETSKYFGRILVVGIAYWKDDTAKKHECKIEVLRERI